MRHSLAGQVGDVDECVVEAGVDVRRAEDIVAGADLRTELNVDLLFFSLTSLWCHLVLDSREYSNSIYGPYKSRNISRRLRQ